MPHSTKLDNGPASILLRALFILTITLFAPRLSADSGVDSLSILRTRQYQQTGSNTITPHFFKSFGIQFSVTGSEPESINLATLTNPDDEILPLMLKDDLQHWEYAFDFLDDNYASLFFPNGTYTFTAKTASGDFTMPLILNHDAPFPTRPKITNFNSLIFLDPDESFTVTWEEFSNPEKDDFTLVEIRRDFGFDFELLFSSGRLTTDTTSITIPADLFEEDDYLELSITFIRPTAKDTTSIPGATGWSGNGSKTIVEIDFNGDYNGGHDDFEEIINSVLTIDLYRQTGDQIVIPAADTPFGGVLLTEAIDPDFILKAEVLTPDNRTVELIEGAHEDEYGWFADEWFASQSARDNRFPAGEYQFEVTTLDDLEESTLTLPADGFSKAPRFTNYAATQTIDPANAFTLTWESFPNPSENDMIIVSVSDREEDRWMPAYHLGTQELLDASLTSLDILPNSLQPNESYFVTLLFFRAEDLSGSAEHVAARMARTVLEIKTTDGGSGPSEGNFEDWANALPPSERGATDDPGSFGIPNLIRYALGLNPLSPERDLLPSVSLTDAGGNPGNSHIAINWRRLKNNPNHSYIVESSIDLENWIPLTLPPAKIEDLGDIENAITISPLPLSEQPRQFLRLRIEQ